MTAPDVAATVPPGGAATPGSTEPTAPALPGTLNPTARTWTLAMPAGMVLLNANHRMHHMAKARHTKTLRAAAAWLTKAQHIPALQRAHILAVYHPPNRHRRDPANLAPSVKACVDGIVADAGVLPDDDAAHLDGPDIRLGEVRTGGQLVLHITELTS